MADLVWVFFVNTRQCEMGEPLGSLDVERAGVLGSDCVARRTTQECDANDEFHRLIL
jgi:hypothetical protein